MFSPAKAITAGTLVFAIGGALLIAQPFDQREGSVPGAETDAVPAGSVDFTARFRGSASIAQGATRRNVGDHVEIRGAAWAPGILGMSDPRLDGAMTYSENVDQYRGSDGSTEFATGTYRIVNDDGAWQGSVNLLTDGKKFRSPVVVLLVGEGAYEGLYAFMDASDWSAVSGVIFPAPPPEAPTAP